MLSPIKNFLNHVYTKTILSLIIFFSGGNIVSSQSTGSLAAMRAKARAAQKMDTTRTSAKASALYLRGDRKGLMQARKAQANRYGIDERTVAEVQDQETPDRFTQTEAHLQMKEVRDLLAKEDSNRFIPYLDIISDCLVREKELQKTHYAFYHTTDNVWRLAQDVYTQLYAKQHPSEKINENFTFLRFTDIKGPQAKNFLVNELKENGLIDDNGEARAILLSVNVALFGNVGFQSECTWEYFLREKQHVAPSRGLYEDMMTRLGCSHKYIDELIALSEIYETKEKTLIQIFVPKKIIDEIGYLAWATGIPAHDETINWVRSNVRNKTYEGKKDPETGDYYAGPLWAMWDLADTFKTEQEKNPLFKDLMESVKAGDYSLDKYLKIYCNKPWDLPNLNHAQARLIFSPDALLNPSSDIKFYRYATTPKEKLKEYYNKLNDLIDKTLTEGTVTTTATATTTEKEAETPTTEKKGASNA